MKSILELRDVSYRYPDGTEALRQMNLQIPQGKKVVLLGANGAGKSTIFQHLNGLLQPTAGQVVYEGKAVGYKRKELLELRKKVGLVFQDPEVQLFATSVFQEISIGPKNFGGSDAEVRQKVQWAMEETDLTHLQDRPPHLLSYGQKKLVSIADILATEPEVLIFDEPTVWLDPLHKEQMLALLEKLHQQGKTLILSTHDVDLAYSWAEYVIVIQKGQVLAEGTPAEIFTQRELIKNAGLEIPWIVEVYEKLQALQKGQGEPIPRTAQELLFFMENNIN